MIDPNLLRNQLEFVAEQLSKRGLKIDVPGLTALEEKRKALQVNTQHLQSQRNALSKAIGQAKAKKEDASNLMEQVATVTKALDETENATYLAVAEQMEKWSHLPNLLDESVPVGVDENDNVEIRKWGTPREFSFTPKDHADLTATNKSIDFEAASKMSGARFVVLRGQISRLNRALTQFMLDVHSNENGYQEVSVPYLVEPHALYGTGQLPNMKEDLFYIQGDKTFCLIPTAEVSLTNLVRDSILSPDELPLKMVSHSPCFRAEAGSHGKDTRGMIRQHQFDKVELVQIVKPEESMQALEELTGHAEKILQKLELPYRVVALCSGDVGFQSAKTYDIEVWIPSQNKYREISSCSNTKDFQARRLQARFRANENEKPQLVHTLNGSGLAVGRTLVAVLENYQDENGNIRIPEVLKSYMNNKSKITLL